MSRATARSGVMYSTATPDEGRAPRSATMSASGPRYAA